MSRYPGATWAARRIMLAGNRVLQAGFERRFGPSLIAEVAGFRMALELRSLHDFRVFRSLRSSGLYEPETSQLLLERIRPGDTFVDVGSNNGYFALLAASRVGPTGRVLAFEPNPASRGRLTRNIELNGFEDRIRVLPIAVGRASGTAQLFVNKFEDGWSSLSEHAETSVTLEVPVRSLDEVLPASDDLFVKVDVEGSELAALEGMSETLRRTENLALIVEWNRTCATRALWDRLNADLSVRNIVSAPGGHALLPIGGWEEIRRTLVTNLFCTRGPRFSPAGAEPIRAG